MGAIKGDTRSLDNGSYGVSQIWGYFFGGAHFVVHVGVPLCMQATTCARNRTRLTKDNLYVQTSTRVQN